MSELKKKSFQLPLDLSLPRVLNKGNFSKTSSNIRALKWVEECPDWPSHVINLYGPSGSGKTHLANIFCEKWNAFVKSQVFGRGCGAAAPRRGRSRAPAAAAGRARGRLRRPGAGRARPRGTGRRQWRGGSGRGGRCGVAAGPR